MPLRLKNIQDSLSSNIDKLGVQRMQTIGKTKNAGKPRTSLRSVVTRSKIIAVAERLFAEQGIQNVSLSAIAKTAKQGNRGVVQHHFGNKEALLQAIIDKHFPAVALARHRMLDGLDQLADYPLRSLVEVLVLPNAAKLDDPDGGRSYLLIRAQLTAESTLAFYETMGREGRTQVGPNDRLAACIARKLAGVPQPVVLQRTTLSISLLFHGLSDLIRMQQLARTVPQALDQGMAIHTLMDSIEAILAAPVSERMRAHFEAVG